MHNSFVAEGKKVIPWILVTILILITSLAGCVQREVTGRAVVDNLALDLWASDRCPNYGEPVTIRATVTNHGSNVYTVELKDQPVLDIYLSYRTTGETLIRWSDGKTLTPDLIRMELKPGESKSIEMRRVTPSGIGFAGVSAGFYYDERSLNNPLGVNLSLTPANCIGH